MQAIPAPLLVQWHQEEVRSLQEREHLLTGRYARLGGHRLTYRSLQAREDGSIEQKVAHRRWQTRQDVLLHVVQQITLAAGEHLEERRTILALLQSESSQLQAGDPAFGAAQKPLHLFCGERRREHLAQILVRLDLSKAQIVPADLGQLPTHPKPGERQARVYAAGEDQMHLRR